MDIGYLNIAQHSTLDQARFSVVELFYSVDLVRHMRSNVPTLMTWAILSPSFSRGTLVDFSLQLYPHDSCAAMVSKYSEVYY